VARAVGRVLRMRDELPLAVSGDADGFVESREITVSIGLASDFGSQGVGMVSVVEPKRGEF